MVSSTSIQVLPLFFSCFCHRLTAMCFVIDLLRRVVVSSIVSLFVGFYIGSSNDKVQSDRVIRSINQVHQ